MTEEERKKNPLVSTGEREGTSEKRYTTGLDLESCRFASTLAKESEMFVLESHSSLEEAEEKTIYDTGRYEAILLVPATRITT